MTTVTLDNCDREPIHIPGAIQPHGALVTLSGSELHVEQASANAASLLDCDGRALHGVALGTLLDAASVTRVRAVADSPSIREGNPVRILTHEGRVLTGVLHRSGAALVLEIEEGWDADAGNFAPGLRGSVLRLQQARDAKRLCEIAAEEVRALTGFDRVMVYRFDADWNGEVVAESRLARLEPFLGLHYPASDIPAQARRLYTENWLRLIADIEYASVPIEPVLSPSTGAPLDLSHAFLRSVSPIHIQYLRNMGVTASMSVSLIIDGQLAGLIACHHYGGPHLVRHTVRETAEYLGQALSWHLRAVERSDAADAAKRAMDEEAAVVRALATSEDFLDGLATEALLGIADADGAAVVLAEGVRRIGLAPDAEQIAKIVTWLNSHGTEVFHTDHLGAHLPEAGDWDGVAAGLLAVAVSHELGEYLLWFRRSTERVVDWAGDPRKSKVPSDTADRLSPRGSFALWRETVRGRSLPWSTWHVDAAANVRAVLLGGVRKRAAALRVLNETLMETDRAKDTFIATVSHELRTPLNAISGWARLLQGKNPPRERLDHAIDVVARNADTLAALVDDLLDVSRMASGKLTLDVADVDMAPLARASVEAVTLSAEAKGIRIVEKLEVESALVRGDEVRLRQVVMNLLTNAIKFTPRGGQVVVELRRKGSNVLLSVSDDGQGIAPSFLPHVFDWFRQADGAMNRRAQGLGLGLAIVKKLVSLHGGTIVAESRGEGLGARFSIELPVAIVTRRTPPRRETKVEPVSGALEGIRVLVVEDEDDSRELVGVLLEEAGAVVTKVADAKTALALVGTARFDLIVSDIGMPGMDGLQFVRDLRTRPVERGGQTPAIALTAYTRAQDQSAALRAGFQVLLAKPVEVDALIACAASLSPSRRPPPP